MSIEGFSETVLDCTQAGRLINGPDNQKQRKAKVLSEIIR